ncbi:MAG: hypothetical protein KC457_14335 [Myxococcales bacterium]|nr:hypothetical protein [Myxococcales bacterium]
MNALTHVPPGLYMIVGALLIAATPGKLHKMWSLLAPLLTLAVIWMFPAEQRLAFDWLDAPVARVCYDDIPMAYAENLEHLSIPQPETIHAALRQVAYRGR